MAAEFPEKIELRRITEARESHFLINGFAGTRTWIFAVDGDEIYDPAGLAKLREGVTRRPVRRVVGALRERPQLHGGRHPPLVRPRLSGAAVSQHDQALQFQFDHRLGGRGDSRARERHGRVQAGLRRLPPLDLHQDLSWDSSHYRCLHTCFVPRSSLDSGAATARPNVSENHRGGVTTLLRKAVNRLRGKPNVSEWKLEKYARGPLVTIDAGAFFPKGPGAARA
ncbi:MAG: hypothetical protein WDN28_28260 [Chthoniobacter sp.]